MFKRRQKKPEEVFTPRSANVNVDMYVHRPSLEERLRDALRGNKYIIIHGESGNGKTWLYKKVLDEDQVEFVTVSLSNARLYGSVSDAINDKLGALGYKEDVANETNTIVGIRPQNVGAERSNKVQEVLQTRGSFGKLVSWVRGCAGKKPCAIIFDNFEQIMDDDVLLAQLRSLIISADDDETSRHNVKILIVGVPGNLKDLISKTRGANPIVNRLVEIPEVGRIDEDDAVELLQKGFFKELNYDVSGITEEEFCEAVAFLTDGIAQQIHEYALQIALEAERNEGVIDTATIQEATKNWIVSTLSSDLAMIEDAMNSRSTDVGRKNQVLYCLGRARRGDFRTRDIESILRSEFNVKGVKLNISQVLSGFANSDNPLIQRTPKDDAWRFSAPRLKIALRAILEKDKNGRVGRASYIDELG